METFNFQVQTKPRGDVRYRRRVAQYGDGYAQKVGDGLHTKVQDWTVTFSGSFDEAQDVIDFLDQHAGYIPFMWTPPGSSSPKYFTCPSFSQVPHVGQQKILVLRFEEDFRP